MGEVTALFDPEVSVECLVDRLEFVLLTNEPPGMPIYDRSRRNADGSHPVLRDEAGVQLQKRVKRYVMKKGDKVRIPRENIADGLFKIQCTRCPTGQFQDVRCRNFEHASNWIVLSGIISPEQVRVEGFAVRLDGGLRATLAEQRRLETQGATALQPRRAIDE